MVLKGKLRKTCSAFQAIVSISEHVVLFVANYFFCRLRCQSVRNTNIAFISRDSAGTFHLMITAIRVVIREQNVSYELCTVLLTYERSPMLL